MVRCMSIKKAVCGILAHNQGCTGTRGHGRQTVAEPRPGWMRRQRLGGAARRTTRFKVSIHHCPQPCNLTA